MTRVVAVTLLLATACGNDPTARPSPSAAPSTPPVTLSATPSCPPGGRADPWPAGVPRDLPRLPGLRVTEPIRKGDAVGARGTAVGTLQASLTFLVQALPAAGYPLGRGSDTPREFLAPFRGNGFSGLYRVKSGPGPCDVTFSVVVARASSTPSP